MKIEAFEINVLTHERNYGFSCTLKDGLNIVRGNNSRGKSTLFNSMIYALGMEELLGGKGDKYLPYALNAYIPEGEKKHVVIESYVKLQIANSRGQHRTLKRMIKSKEKSTKLIDVINGQHITNKSLSLDVQSTYVHDPGAAQNNKIGFYRFLEKFCGLDLPNVASTSGDDVKLYIQTLFAAVFVEQKRGWTDYIANIPYFKIKNAKSKIIEFFLNLDVFENNKQRNLLNKELSIIQQEWEEARYELKLIENKAQVVVKEISKKPIIDFEPNFVSIKKISEGSEVSLEEFIEKQLGKIQKIKEKQSKVSKEVTEEQLKSLGFNLDEVGRLNVLYESMSESIRINRSLLDDYKEKITTIESDLEKNKAAKKIRDLGGSLDLKIASDKCPACRQTIDDSLLLVETLSKPMSIDDNVSHLKKQLDMIKKYVVGVKGVIKKEKVKVLQIEDAIKSHKKNIISIKRDVASVSELSEADVRNKIRCEDAVEILDKVESDVEKIKEKFVELSKKFKSNKKSRASLPSDGLSKNDEAKIKKWEREFKKLADKYGYKSADVNEVSINRDNYLPFLSGLELREIFDGKKQDADIKADSSASDFVRLIWAYLLSLSKVSYDVGGNHLGLILFDEPGQHSMADTSVNALLSSINLNENLQCVVGASFDENDSVFEAETRDVSYHLIEIKDKLLQPV